MPFPAITMAAETIHNPSEPRHFMRVKPVKARVRVRAGDAVLAETTAALRVIEIGRDAYDPALYIPRADISPSLMLVAGKSSHCPLKGDCSYLALEAQEPIAWSYDRPLDIAEVLRDYVAFYADKVTIEETGAKAP